MNKVIFFSNLEWSMEKQGCNQKETRKKIEFFVDLFPSHTFQYQRKFVMEPFMEPFTMMNDMNFVCCYKRVLIIIPEGSN